MSMNSTGKNEWRKRLKEKHCTMPAGTIFANVLNLMSLQLVFIAQETTRFWVNTRVDSNLGEPWTESLPLWQQGSQSNSQVVPDAIMNLVNRIRFSDIKKYKFEGKEKSLPSGIILGTEKSLGSPDPPAQVGSCLWVTRHHNSMAYLLNICLPHSHTEAEPPYHLLVRIRNF